MGNKVTFNGVDLDGFNFEITNEEYRQAHTGTLIPPVVIPPVVVNPNLQGGGLMGNEVAGGYVDPYSPAGARFGDAPSQREYAQEQANIAANPPVPKYKSYWDGTFGGIDYSKPASVSGKAQ